jgi:MFS family permease
MPEPESRAAGPPGAAAQLAALFADRRFCRVWLTGGIAGTLRWLENLAVGVFVYQATGSPSLVALMTFVRLGPMLLLGLPAGALAERFDRKWLLFAGLAVLAVTSAILAALAASGRITLWHIALGAFMGGAFWAGEFPVRRTMIGEIIGRGHLATAMGLESATSNATRMVGPLLGGLLLQVAGLEAAYLISALFYGLAALLIWPLRYRAEAPAGAALGMLREIAEGLAYARSQRLVLATLAVTLVVNLWGFAYIALVPVIGEAQLQLSAFLTGVLMSAEGLGALIGALAVGALARPWHYTRVYLGFSFLFLAMVLLFALSRSFPLSLAALFASGIGIAGFAVMQSTIMFLSSPPKLRSRLMGLLTVSIGTGPLGMLHVGYLADWLGAGNAILIMAIEGLLALVLVAWWWPELWRTRDLARFEDPEAAP